MLALSGRVTAVEVVIVAELGVGSVGGMVDSFVSRVRLYVCTLVLSNQLLRLQRNPSEQALSIHKITTSGLNLKRSGGLE